MQFRGRGGYGGRGGRGGYSTLVQQDRPRVAQRVEEKPDNSPIGGVVGSIVRLGDIVISSAPDNATKETLLVPIDLPTDTAVYSQASLSLDEQLKRTTTALSLTVERDFTLFTDIILSCVVAQPAKTLVYTALVAQLTAANKQFGAYFMAQLGRRVTQAVNTLAEVYAPASLKGLAVKSGRASTETAAAAAAATTASVSALVSSGFGAASKQQSAALDARLRLRLLVRVLLCLVGAGVVSAKHGTEAVRKLLADAGVISVAEALKKGGSEALAPLPTCAPAAGARATASVAPTASGGAGSSASASMSASAAASAARAAARAAPGAPAVAAAAAAVRAATAARAAAAAAAGTGAGAPAAADASAGAAAAKTMQVATVVLPPSCVGVCVPLADAAAESVLDALAYAAPLLQHSHSLTRPAAASAPAAGAAAVAPPASPVVVPVLVPLLEAWAVARNRLAGAGQREGAWLASVAPGIAAASGAAIGVADSDEFSALLSALLGRPLAASNVAQSDENVVPVLVEAFSVLSPSPSAYGAVILSHMPPLTMEPWTLPPLTSATTRSQSPVLAAARFSLAASSAESSAAAAITAAATAAAAAAAPPASSLVALVGGLPLNATPLPPADAFVGLNAGARALDLLLLLRVVNDLVLTHAGMKEEMSLALLTLPPLVRPAAAAAATAAPAPSDADAASVTATDAGETSETAPSAAPVPASAPAPAAGIYSSSHWGNSIVSSASVASLHLVSDTLLSMIITPSRFARSQSAAVERILIDLVQLQHDSLPSRLGPRLFSLFAHCGALTPSASARLASYHAFHFTNLGFGWPWEAWVSALSEPLSGPHSLFVRTVLEVVVRLTHFKFASSTIPANFHTCLPPDSEPFDFLSLAQAMVSSAAGSNPSLPAPLASMVEASAAFSAVLESALKNKATAADATRLAESFAAQPMPGTLGAGTAPVTDPTAAAANARNRASSLLSECCLLGVWPSLSSTDSTKFVPGAGTDAIHPALLALTAAILRTGKMSLSHMRSKIDKMSPALKALSSPSQASTASPMTAPALQYLPDVAACSVSVCETTGAISLQPHAAHWAIFDCTALFWRSSRKHVEVILPSYLRAGLVTPESAVSWLLGPAPFAGVFSWGPFDVALWDCLHSVVRLALADLAVAAAKIRTAAAGPRVVTLAPQLAEASTKVLVRQGQFLSGTLAALAALEKRAPELAKAMEVARGNQSGDVPPPATSEQITQRIQAAGREIIEVFADAFAEAAAYISPDVATHYKDSLCWVFTV